VWQGVEYWADWVNQRGGIIYDGVGHQVEVITHDASSLNTAQQVANIQSVYLSATHTLSPPFFFFFFSSLYYILFSNC
jgi:hypothetical protein